MSATSDAPPKAVIFGLSGPTLTDEERAFFEKTDPLGFILFARNIENPEQVKSLTAALRDSVGRDDAPILIDQEGGRVQRLRPPYWRQAPTARSIGGLWEESPDWGRAAAKLNAAMMALELTDLGIDVDCTPVLDIPVPGAHDIIGDRAYGLEPEIVADLGRAVCAGMLESGVMPIVKHIPGHGRAFSDSHLELPKVDASREELEMSDFAPFRALGDAPWGMTAHIVYTDIDDTAPATLSKHVVQDVIRHSIGFEGVLLTDDLSMKALTGSFEDRTRISLEAGCDVVLHCNGEADEMDAIASVVAPLRDDSLVRLQRSREMMGVPS